MNKSDYYIRQTDYYCIIQKIQGTWIPNFEEGKIYSSAIEGYLTPRIDKNGYQYIHVNMMTGFSRIIYLHRALLIMKTGFPLDHRLEVDHINHDPGDNRICNLRWATVSENHRNRPWKFVIAEEIRRERAAGVPVKKLAKKYQYSVSMIRDIVVGRCYNPALYPRDTKKPRLHYAFPFSGGAFLRWCA